MRQSPYSARFHYMYGTTVCAKLWGIMRSSRLVRASDCKFKNLNSPGFDPSILRHSEIWGVADEAVLNKVHKNNLGPYRSSWYFTVPYAVTMLSSSSKGTGGGMVLPDQVADSAVFKLKSNFLFSSLVPCRTQVALQIRIGNQGC